MANVRKVLTRTNFKNWLESKKPNQVVGLAVEPAACPIFNFLVANDIQCTGITASWGVKVGKWLKIPKWTKDFIKQIDYGNKDRAKISAKKALETLDRII
jgi:hypothetical protein